MAKNNKCHNKNHYLQFPSRKIKYSGKEIEDPEEIVHQKSQNYTFEKAPSLNTDCKLMKFNSASYSILKAKNGKI